MEFRGLGFGENGIRVWDLRVLGLRFRDMPRVLRTHLIRLLGYYDPQGTALYRVLEGFCWVLGLQPVALCRSFRLYSNSSGYG